MDHAAQQRLVIDLLSPLVTAAFLSSASCGVVVCLAATYFFRFARDRAVFKLLVGGLTVLALAGTAIECSFAFNWAVLHFGDYSVFARLNWQMKSYFFLTGIPVLVVELYYGWRIWVISGRGNYLLTGLIGLGSIAAFACIMRGGVYTMKHDAISAFHAIRPTIIAWIVLLIAVDLLVTCGTLYYLVFRPRRDGAGLLAPNSRITSLALLTVKTNSISLFVQVFILVLLLIFPRAFHFGALSFLETKIYVGSLVATLNARDATTLATRAGSGDPPPWDSFPSHPPLNVHLSSPGNGGAGAAEEGRAAPVELGGLSKADEADRRRGRRAGGGGTGGGAGFPTSLAQDRSADRTRPPGQREPERMMDFVSVLRIGAGEESPERRAKDNERTCSAV
ncbi:hypothetical protein JCM8097_006222 [Rhodosporidiobolus ruineniae]